MRENEIIIDENNFERIATRVADQVFSERLEKKVNYLHKGLEYDAFYEDEFNSHYIEYTVSKKKTKAQHDLRKLVDIMTDPTAPGSKKNKNGWFITKYSLSPEQQLELNKVKSVKIRHETYQDFVSRLIDTGEYLSARSNHNFGSAIDPETGTYEFKKEKFVRTPMRFLSGGSGRVNFDQLFKLIEKGSKKRIILTGDFGAGKSMHLREIFLKLAKKHTVGQVDAFPVALNMREFAQLETPDEALRRHAERLGSKHLGEKLIRAWKAGFVTLLIDGFDEMVPRTSAKDARRVQDIRRQSLLVIRRLVSETPADSTIVISGRSHYFSTDEEMHSSLGTNQDHWSHVRMEDFATDDDVKKYLDAYGADFAPPRWIPKRPLLLSYLASLTELETFDPVGLSPARGWSIMLDKFCEREVQQIDTLPLVKSDLVEIYGDLATRARRREAGVGPVTLSDLVDGYRNIFGDEPIASELGQLLRLPGLVSSGELALVGSVVGQLSDSDTKAFVSQDFCDACSILLLARFKDDPKAFRIRPFSGVRHTVSSCGTEVLNNKLPQHGDVNFLLGEINQHSPDSPAHVDVIQCLAVSGRAYSGKNISIRGCEDCSLDLRNVSASLERIHFRNCYFRKILIGDVSEPTYLPSFDNCLIETLIFEGEYRNIEGHFSSCTVDERYVDERNDIENQQTLGTPREKIFYDILRKVFRQAGPGRISKALYSGVPSHERSIVDEVLDKLKSNGIVYVENTGGGAQLWKPVQGMTGRVSEYLDAPKEAFFEECLA